VPGKRTYADSCGVARALDVVGERWALLVVRELLLGPKRFTDLRAGLPTLGPDVLAQRLRDLEAAGVLARRTLPPPAGSRVYELTAWGRGLEPAILALAHWGDAAPGPAAPDAPRGADSAVLGLRAAFDPAAAGGWRATYALHLGADVFHVRIADGRMALARGAPPERPDVIIETSPDTLTALLRHETGLGDARRAGTLRFAGDKALVKRLLRGQGRSTLLVADHRT